MTRNIFSPAYRAALPGVGGTVITGLAVISVLLGIWMWTGRAYGGAAVVTLLLAVVAAVTVMADYLDVKGGVEILRTTYFRMVDFGVGMYVTATGVTPVS